MSLQDIYDAVKESVMNNHFDDDDDFIFDEMLYMERLTEVLL